MTTEKLDMFPYKGFVNGNIAGIQAFRTMLNRATATGEDAAAQILRTLNDAIAAVHAPEASTTHKSAAIKLLELVANALEFRARQAGCGAWLDAEMEEAQKQWQTVTKLESMRSSKRARQDQGFQSFLSRSTTNETPESAAARSLPPLQDSQWGVFG